MSIPETWLERIDHSKNRSVRDINKQAVGRMMDAAVCVLQEASGMCTDIYIFKDGSSLYEKHRNHWYPDDNFVQCPECEDWRRGDVEKCGTCLTVAETRNLIREQASKQEADVKLSVDDNCVLFMPLTTKGRRWIKRERGVICDGKYAAYWKGTDKWSRERTDEFPDAVSDMLRDGLVLDWSEIPFVVRTLA